MADDLGFDSEGETCKLMDCLYMLPSDWLRFLCYIFIKKGDIAIVHVRACVHNTFVIAITFEPLDGFQ